MSDNHETTHDTDRLCSQICFEIEETFIALNKRVSEVHEKKDAVMQTEKEQVKMDEEELTKKIGRIKSFARDLLKKGPKAEFKLYDFFEEMKERGIM